MPCAASRTSAGTPSSPATMLRTRISSVYPTRPISAVVTVSPVHGTRNANRASDGMVYSTPVMPRITRLVEPTGGRILLDGEDVARVDPVRLRRRIGYVIQHVGLFPHQTVADNVATVPRLLGWDRRRARARADELLELVGLEPGVFRNRYPDQLSGGQRQRVGVA